MSHVLVGAATGAPVPLPYHTVRADEPVTVHDFNDACVKITGLDKSVRHQWIRPALVGLAIITEEEFMARQQSNTFIDCYQEEEQ